MCLLHSTGLLLLIATLQPKRSNIFHKNPNNITSNTNVGFISVPCIPPNHGCYIKWSHRGPKHNFLKHLNKSGLPWCIKDGIHLTTASSSELAIDHKLCLAIQSEILTVVPSHIIISESFFFSQQIDGSIDHSLGWI
ncbi:hypothetical protein Hanom_Chr03g00263151 [Helianthus anomalus]